MDDAEYFITAAKTARGIVMSKQVFLLGLMGSGAPLVFPNEADGDSLAEFVALGTAASSPENWRSEDYRYGTLLQHDMQVLVPTVANSAAVARWFESLVATMRDWKPSLPHRLPWARTRGGHTLTLDTVSLCCGTDFDEQTVLVAGGLYCEPLAAEPPAPAQAALPPAAPLPAALPLAAPVPAALPPAAPAPPPVALPPAPAAAQAARRAPAVVQYVYEDEPLPTAWTPEQCAAFDTRCAGYHARMARVNARVAQLVGAWHAVPMTLG
jgi:hypothetical protein